MRKVTHTSIELIADEGMILTDGKHYAKAVLLPYEDEGENWREIPESEKPVVDESGVEFNVNVAGE